MLIKTILFKNNLIKKIKSKNILKTKKEFLKLKEDYEKKKIPLLTSFEKNYKLNYSKKLVKILRKKKNIILVGMGGSILGAKALYSFLKRKIKKNFFLIFRFKNEYNAFAPRIEPPIPTKIIFFLFPKTLTNFLSSQVYNFFRN